MNQDYSRTEQWQRAMEGRSPEEIVNWAWRTFETRVVFATSLGLEDQAVTDMIARIAPAITLFTLDTGRLFQESYELVERTEMHYGLHIQVYYPADSEVEGMVNEHGINLFRKSPELRKHCCFVRKIQPLRRALAGMDAWICGLRREQSVTRHDLQEVEWDEANGLVKINPLARWSDLDVKAYVSEHQVPYNPLHDQGFPSIGCACCTRTIRSGEDIRSGRWWWETPERRECGLHWKDGKPIPVSATPAGKLGEGGSLE